MNFCGCVCPVCGGNFHACSSCGLEHDWEYFYCSEECWRLSDEYRKKMERLSLLVHRSGLSLEEIYNDLYYDDVLRDAATRFKYFDDYMDYATKLQKGIDDANLTNRMKISMVDTEGIEDDEDTEN